MHVHSEYLIYISVTSNSSFSPQLHSVSPQHPKTYMSLQGLLLLWTYTCPLVSFLMMFSSFRTGQSSRSSQAATPTLTFLLSATQDVLLPLLKLTVYPNDLIYILKVRPYCFQFSHTNSFHLFCTADSLSLTPMVKMELHCSQARTTEKQLPQMV